ncbi:PACE efflux transporter [Vibrio sp. SCSIO 43136]|uniref:PACE efflux transporter n=1 Tax=Vibrio sp. SCSIO 43136 TaxID=2819101 RepID=UPI0020752ED0|nr:PACE efflux transporter [Vibrio sp. SCSIO 43136]USD67433.1 PACE efflux transporter [Vibrio sp. SCSIO 43136]
MGTLERVFHAVLFEVLAVLLSIALLMLATDHEVGSLSGTMIIVATIAMCWNFVFNWFFDQLYTGDKEKRSMKLRLLHVTLFEIGLLVFTIPVIAYILGVVLWEAFMMDVGITIFITIYAFTFNLVYDKVRAVIVKKSRKASSVSTI